MVADFWNFYFSVLIYNFLAYLCLIHCFKTEVRTFKLYLLAFICANVMPITDGLGIVLVGGGHVPYTVNVYWILKACILAQELVKILFIVYAMRSNWFKYYWWGIIVQIILGIMYVWIYQLKFVSVVEGVIAFTPITIDTVTAYMVSLVCIGLFGFIFILISKFLISKINFNYLSKWVWFSIYTAWGGVVLISDKSYVNDDTTSSILSGMSNIMQIAAFMVLAIILLFITVSRSEKKILLMENQLLKQQCEIQYNNFMVKEQHDTNICKLYHDIGNHLATIKVLLEGDNEAARQYADSLLTKYSSIKRKYFSDNKIINAVLISKIDFMEENSITYNIEICVPEVLNIKDIDVMSVFSNLLDNAIENCIKDDVVKRYIHIKVATIKNYLTFHITNSKSVKEIQEKGNYTTWKKDKNLHGYGLKIIQEIKERYEGEIQYKDHGDHFQAMVMLRN